MSQVRIRKSFRVISCTVATAASSCTAIRMDDMSGGVVQRQHLVRVRARPSKMVPITTMVVLAVVEPTLLEQLVL